MARSTRMTGADVRAAMRLVGETLELGADREAWQGHLADGLRRQTGSAIGVVCEVEMVREGATTWPRHWVMSAAEGPDRLATWQAHTADIMRDPDPFMGRMMAAARRLGSCAREQMCDDDEYFASRSCNEMCRPCGLDGTVISVATAPAVGGGCALFVHWDEAGRRPTRREVELVALIQAEVAPRIGTRLASAADPVASALTPRQRDALARLLTGESEKEAAARLGVSPHTLHQYAKAVYRHYGVGTRAELMAYFLRHGGPRAVAVNGDTPFR